MGWVIYSAGFLNVEIDHFASARKRHTNSYCVNRAGAVPVIEQGNIPLVLIDSK
jgi:hypothetical protein